MSNNVVHDVLHPHPLHHRRLSKISHRVLNNCDKPGQFWSYCDEDVNDHKVEFITMTGQPFATLKMALDMQPDTDNHSLCGSDPTHRQWKTRLEWNFGNSRMGKTISHWNCQSQHCHSNLIRNAGIAAVSSAKLEALICPAAHSHNS